MEWLHCGVVCSACALCSLHTFLQDKLKSICDHTMKVAIHSVLLVLGWAVVPFEDWFSWTSSAGVWHEWEQQTFSQPLKWYYYMQGAAACSAFCFHFLEEKKKVHLNGVEAQPAQASVLGKCNAHVDV